MEINKLIRLGDTIEKIQELTDTTIPDIVDALVGVAWDEEDARQLKRYHRNEGGE